MGRPVDMAYYAEAWRAEKAENNRLRAALERIAAAEVDMRRDGHGFGFFVDGAQHAHNWMRDEARAALSEMASNSEAEPPDDGSIGPPRPEYSDMKEGGR